MLPRATVRYDIFDATGGRMKATAIIPARFASTRFPGKPLAKDTGKYLVQHVYEQVASCPAIGDVVVATDDERIAQAVESFGGRYCMTRSDHPSGTDRIAEAVSQLGLSDDALVLNVQGDEPDISSDVLVRLVHDMLESHNSCRIGTLACPFCDDGPKSGAGSPADPNCVKVVVDETDKALYFSRSLIPYPRETEGVVDQPSRWLLHVGVYAFRVDTLQRIVGDKKVSGQSLEASESLEQLRWLAMGEDIKVSIVDHYAVGIDTPEDYAAFVERFQHNQNKTQAEVPL